MRHVLILLLALGAVAAFACSGGDKEVVEGQPDYLQRVVDVSTRLWHAERDAGCEKTFDGEVPRSCKHEVFAAAFKREVEHLGELRPPGELAREHRRAIEMLLGIEQLIGVPTEEIVDRAREIPQLRSADVLQQWTDAIEEFYDVRLVTFEGASMAPTFEDGDTVAFPPLMGGSIGRGEVALFAFHLDESREFLKRIIGLPGETIEVRDGAVYVDGLALTEDYLLNQPNYEYGPKTVPDGHYFVLGDNRRNSFDSHAWGMNCPPEQMCDFVPEENIIGVLPADAQGPQDD